MKIWGGRRYCLLVYLKEFCVIYEHLWQNCNTTELSPTLKTFKDYFNSELWGLALCLSVPNDSVCSVFLNIKQVWETRVKKSQHSSSRIKFAIHWFHWLLVLNAAIFFSKRILIFSLYTKVAHWFCSQEQREIIIILFHYYQPLIQEFKSVVGEAKEQRAVCLDHQKRKRKS